MAEINSLELVATKTVAGSLETNIGQLERYVDAKLEEYKPELYAGDADSARKDRAEINSGIKALSQKRIAIMKELMKPFADFEERCKVLEAKMKSAAVSLDGIVKEKERKEKDAKLADIELEWQNRNFNLFALEKIFDSRWLNKTCKMSEVRRGMDEAIERTYKDLKTIERFGSDAETLKAHYLDTLDIGETLDYGEELEKNRKKVAQEAAEREIREHEQKLDEQRRGLQEEQKIEASVNRMSALVSAALDEEPKPETELPPKAEAKTFALTVRTTQTQMMCIKDYLCKSGIEYVCREIVF
nr:MAG TPA: Protein of unknown function (DUF1351) [Caudoviricetes sp.]